MPVFSQTFHNCFAPKRYICNQGGTRSSKTYSVLQALVVMAFKEPLTIDVFRRFSANHDKGALPDLFRVLQEYNLPFEYNASTKTFKLGAGSIIRFSGADDIQKLRGPQRDVLFMNEATEFTKDMFDELNQRTSQKVILDFNPWAKSHWVYELKKLYPGKVAFFKTTYRDNPSLNQEQIDAIEAYERIDPAKWRIYGLGERVIPEELIYPDAITLTAVPPEASGEVVYGIDFGSTSPTAMVKVTRVNGRLYVEELVYQRNMSTEELVKTVKAIVGNRIVYCDAAEPDRIRALQETGVQAYGAIKDVQAGISYMRGYTIYIVNDPETGKGLHLQKEIDSYSWRRDRNTGQLLDDPVKNDDHLMDAMRYAVYTRWGKVNTNRAYRPPASAPFLPEGAM